MLKRWQMIGAVTSLYLALCLPAAPARSVVPVPTTGLKPAITDSPIRAGRSVQLGAWRSEAQAVAAWKAIQQRSGTLLDGLTPDVLPVDLPAKGRFYRLRVKQPDSRAAANLCTALRAKRLACVVVPD